MELTPKQELVNDRLRAEHSTDLRTYIATRRTAGKSWQDIAFGLRSDIKVTVTAESIRGWAVQLGITPTTSTTDA